MRRLRLDPLAVMVGIWATLWGLWVLMPWGTFDSSPSFQRLDAVGTEWGWGLFALACGLAVLQPRWKHVRFVGFCGAVFLSGCLATTFIMSNWKGTAAPTYGAILLGCMWGLIVGTKDI